MDEYYPNEFTAPLPPAKKRCPMVVGVCVLAVLIVGIVLWLVLGHQAPKVVTGQAAIPAQVQQRISTACAKATNPATCQFNVITSDAAKTDNPAGCQGLTGDMIDKCLFMVALSVPDKAACNAISDKAMKTSCAQALAK